MNINIFNLLIVSGIFYGCFFSLSIYLSKKNRIESSSYLASVVLFLSISNLYYWIEDAGLWKKSSDYLLFHIPWGLLVLPFYYLFVRAYFQKVSKNKYLFFLPFLLCLPIHGYILFSSLLKMGEDSNLISFAKTFYFVEELFAAIFTLYVIWKTYLFIKSSETNLEEDNHQIVKIETQWLKNLLLFGLLICFFWVSSTLYSNSNPNSEYVTAFRYAVWIGISVLIYWLGYLGNYYGVVFKQRTVLRKRIRIESEKQPKKNPKIEMIKKNIEKEKLFLDPLLNASKASEKLNLSENYFTHIFSQNSQDSFSNYIKKLRVEEAKNLLTHSDYKEYTIVSIGLESGFNSKSAFYRVFKEETGLTPSEYKRRNLSHF